MDINDSKLYKILNERQSKFLPNIQSIFNYAQDILPQIINVFSSYTQHDLDHSILIMNYMHDLVDDITQFNDLEITMMVYSALLHDIGMVVTEDEVSKIKEDDTTITEYRYSVVVQEQKNEKLALQECIRPIHAKRSVEHIEKMKAEQKAWFLLPGSTTINFSQEVQKICQAHNESFEWLKSELTESDIKGKYSYNTQYIAMLLRVSDLLDIDEKRTPMYLYYLVNPKGYSDLEWRQHFVIENTEKIYTNPTTKQKTIKLYGESSDAKIHRKIRKYIEYINQELVHAASLMDSFQETKYHIQLKSIVEDKIKTTTFTFSNFKLDLDYNAVTNLLMGEHIYGDKKYGLRELVQNSIDACMLMKEVSENLEDYKFDKEVRITDNGVGMSLDILKKYFLNVGVSYYSSQDYKYKGYTYNPIGNYGIGFLSCFMLSSKVKVDSKRYDDQKLNKIELERNSEYICLTQEASTRKQGTDIILNLDQVKEIFPDIEKTKIFIERNFIDCGISIKIWDDHGSNKVSTQCNLKELKENSLNVVRLDKYLKDVEGYVELTCNDIVCVDNLKDVEGEESYVYANSSLVEESVSNVNIDEFVDAGQISYLRLPIISKENSNVFNKYCDVLDDFDKALEKLKDEYHVDYLHIFCIDKDEFEENTLMNLDDLIIGNYDFNNFCIEHGHARNSWSCKEIIDQSVIGDNIGKVLLYEKEKKFNGKNFWERSDEIFIKNVLISEFVINLPTVVRGISLKSARFNIKNKKIIPNVSRNNVQKCDAEKFSYAIGKAIHLWILDNIKLGIYEQILLKKLIKTCYAEKNEFMK